jgi:hypothetical protein
MISGALSGAPFFRGVKPMSVKVSASLMRQNLENRGYAVRINDKCFGVDLSGSGSFFASYQWFSRDRLGRVNRESIESIVEDFELGRL